METRHRVRKGVAFAPGRLAALVCGPVMMFIPACSPRDGSRHSQHDSTPPPEQFHADNDIAMTVCSVADALRVGEPLDTLSYNFDGVLTDGQGRPIYTDLHGVPGKWDVDAVSDTSLTIRNVDLGDLLPDDLENYIVSALGIDDASLIDSLSKSVPEGHTTRVYDFGGGSLRFEVHNVTTPSDQTAAMMIISLAK